MKTFEDMIHAYLHDGRYNEFLVMKKGDFAISDKAKNPEYISLQSELEALLVLGERGIGDIVRKNTLGVYGYPIESKHNPQFRYSILVEKMYFDLYHEDPKFKPELLKFIDPKTGELKA